MTNTDWTSLLDSMETSEVATHSPTAPVDVPSPLLLTLQNLRKPGTNGGRQRAMLKVSSNAEFEMVRRVLRAAGAKLEPAASVTTKPVWAEGDEYVVDEVKDGEKTGKKTFRIRENAVPIGIRFTVGDRRGAKANTAAAPETSDTQVSPETTDDIVPEAPVEPKSRVGRRK